MKFKRCTLKALLSTATLFIGLFGASVSQGADRLDEILSSMQRAGDGMKTMSADFTQTNHDYILSEEEIVSGKLYLEIPGLIRWEYEPPQEKVLLVKGDKVSLYNPTARQVQEFKRGKMSGAGADLLIGFGRSNESLKQNYDVSLLDENDESVQLKLIPKPDSSASLFTSIDLTIDKERWTPLKSVFHEPNRDHTVIVFQSVAVNSPLPKNIFELKLPAGVEVVRGGF